MTLKTLSICMVLKFSRFIWDWTCLSPALYSAAFSMKSSIIKEQEQQNMIDESVIHDQSREWQLSDWSFLMIKKYLCLLRMMGTCYYWNCRIHTSITNEDPICNGCSSLSGLYEYVLLKIGSKECNT